MRKLWVAAVLLALGGCGTVEPTTYREDPMARSNPALMNCARGKPPVCQVDGGRARKSYYNCRCL